MSKLFLAIAVILILAGGLLISFLRGLGKSRIRGICVLASAVLAVILTLSCRNMLASEGTVDWILAWMESMNVEQAREILEISPTLNEVVLKVIAAFVAPIVCLLLFIVLMIITWIIYLVLTLTLGNLLRESNQKARFRLPRSLVWGFVQGVVIVVMVLLPVSAVLEYAPTALDAVLESGMVEGESAEALDDVLQNELKPANEGVTLTVYRVLGGKALTGLLTDFEINDKKVHLADEVDSVASFACNIVRLTKTEFAKYTSKEATVFVAVADSFEDSVLLPTIAGEVIYSATDAWLQDKAFLGAEKPVLKGEMEDVTTPFMEALLRILHADAKNHLALQADFRTVADMIVTLADHEVFANIGDIDALMRALSSDGIINSLVASLGANESMKLLIPEITNMGVRAVAMTLKIPADITEVYGDLLNDVTVALNSVKTLDDEVQIAQLSKQLTTAFDTAGIPVDKEIIDCYSVSMMKDLIEESNGRELTVNDVQAFFINYDMNAEVPTVPTEPLAATDPFKGTVYEGKTEEELKKTGAAALAKVTKKLAELDANDKKLAKEQAKQALNEVYGELVAASPAAKAVLESLEIEKPVSTETLSATAGLKDVDSVQSQRVTMQDLLIDTEAAAKKINEETLAGESAMIAGIFNAAASLKDTTTSGEELDIAAMSNTMGTILDSLNTSAIYGEGQTKGLFTAVLQSETVRDAAKIDMATATQMAEKGTANGGDYANTMGALASGVTVMSKFGADGEKVDPKELEEMIRKINPQTAGMLQVYATPERLVEYNMPADYADTSSELITETFGYLADAELAEDDFAKEAVALNHILDLALAAKAENESGTEKPKRLFTSMDGTDEGYLPNADTAVHDILASKSISHSLRVTILNADGTVKEDKWDDFGLNKKIPTDSADYNDLIAARDAAYAADPTEDTYNTLKALSALFGLEFNPQ